MNSNRARRVDILKQHTSALKIYCLGRRLYPRWNFLLIGAFWMCRSDRGLTNYTFILISCRDTASDSAFCFCFTSPLVLIVSWLLIHRPGQARIESFAPFFHPSWASNQKSISPKKSSLSSRGILMRVNNAFCLECIMPNPSITISARSRRLLGSLSLAWKRRGKQDQRPDQGHLERNLPNHCRPGMKLFFRL